MKESIASLAMAFVIGLCVSLILAIPIMVLWNSVMLHQFGLKHMDYEHAFYFTFLVRLLIPTGSSTKP